MLGNLGIPEATFQGIVAAAKTDEDVAGTSATDRMRAITFTPIRFTCRISRRDPSRSTPSEPRTRFRSTKRETRSDRLLGLGAGL
jgi:hypothetical protein